MSDARAHRFTTRTNWHKAQTYSCVSGSTRSLLDVTSCQPSSITQLGEEKRRSTRMGSQQTTPNNPETEKMQPTPQITEPTGEARGDSMPPGDRVQAQRGLMPQKRESDSARLLQRLKDGSLNAECL